MLTPQDTVPNAHTDTHTHTHMIRSWEYTSSYE